MCAPSEPVEEWDLARGAEVLTLETFEEGLDETFVSSGCDTESPRTRDTYAGSMTVMALECLCC